MSLHELVHAKEYLADHHMDGGVLNRSFLVNEDIAIENLYPDCTTPLSAIQPIRSHYEELLMTYHPNTKFSAAILKLSNPETIAEFDAMIDEFNSRIMGMIERNEIREIVALVQEAKAITNRRYSHAERKVLENETQILREVIALVTNAPQEIEREFANLQGKNPWLSCFISITSGLSGWLSSAKTQKIIELRKKVQTIRDRTEQIRQVHEQNPPEEFRQELLGELRKLIE